MWSPLKNTGACFLRQIFEGPGQVLVGGEATMSLEEDFFAAEDAQSRADLYADFDPDAQPARAERRIFLFIGVGLLIVLGLVFWMMPATEADSASPKSTASVAAAKAPASKAAPPPQRGSRLARLLKRNASAAGAAPSPPVPAPAAESDGLDAVRQHIEAEEFDQALSALGDADGFQAQALRGWALYELGRDADARRALRAALALRPNHPESLLLLGSLEQSRDHSAAKQTYEAFLAAHPNAPQAREVRQILERI
jgi:cytochrome c-type biogenesis protein CcmH/NrfG